MLDKVARSCVRLVLPVLSHTEADSYLALSTAYYNSGSVQDVLG